MSFEADHAAEVWFSAKYAAQILSYCVGTIERPSINLGPGLSEALMRELAGVSGGTFESYRYLDETEGSLPMVCWRLDATASGVRIWATNSRPATAADESLPLRGGRS